MTLVDWEDLPRWILINKTLGLSFEDPVETYSTSPHLFADLGIPEGTKGMLPKAQQTLAGLSAEAVEDLGETGRARPKRNGGGSKSGGRSGDRNRRSGGSREKRETSERKEQPKGDGESRRPARKRSRRRTRSGSDVAAPEAVTPTAAD